MGSRAARRTSSRTCSRLTIDAGTDGGPVADGVAVRASPALRPKPRRGYHRRAVVTTRDGSYGTVEPGLEGGVAGVLRCRRTRRASRLGARRAVPWGRTASGDLEPTGLAEYVGTDGGDAREGRFGRP